MSDLVFCMVAATALKVFDRPAGDRHMIMAWVRPSGGNEPQDIKREFNKRGWHVNEIRHSKRVPSEDPGADEAVRVALAQARDDGFAFLIYSKPPR